MLPNAEQEPGRLGLMSTSWEKEPGRLELKSIIEEHKLREALKKKIQNVNFFQIGLDPPPLKFEPEFLMKFFSN